ncbi:serine protease [Nocardia sp. NPDC051570]|uniref:serine protease n=1 Tax=Nocardia sp. NPDC051570 TaxID=3364324 RepID=UPI0037A8864F
MMLLFGIGEARRAGLLGVAVTAVLGAGSLIASAPADAIVGGVLEKDGDSPWQVSVQAKGWSGYTHACGGSIIDARTIVTAAHCVQGKTAADLRVGYGSLKYSQTTPVAVSDVRVHENYEARTSSDEAGTKDYSNDVAVLKLAQDIPVDSGDPNIGTVALASSGNDPAKGTPVTVSGWGVTRSGGSIPADLYRVTVPIVDRPTCNTAYAQYGGVDDSMICAAEEEGGHDRCQSDDGGPAVTIDGGTATLVGIVSWGYGCAVKGYPGVYARIGNLRSWIDAHRS